MRSLSTQNRNLFQKIFEEIKYLCKIVTSGSKEARELEKVKKVFSDVYRESGTTQKNTTKEGGVRYDINLSFDKKAQISYDSLIAKDDMVISNVTTSFEEVRQLSRNEIIEAARKKLSSNKDSNGVISIYNADIGENIVVGKPGLSHGLDHDYEYTAMVTLDLKSYLQNAIKINEAIADENRDHDSDILLGYGETAKGEKIPAYFVVSKLSTGINELVEFGSLYSINAKKIAEDSTQGGPGFQSRTSATISIAKLLDIVNSSYSDILPQSVSEHYGTQRRNTKLGRSVKYSLSNDGEQATKKYGDYAVSGEDIRLGVQDDIAPLPENTESDAEYPDDYAPIGEGIVEDDAEIDGIIKTIRDGLSQKRQNYETERKNLTVKQQETLSNIDTKIAETQANYDGKKNKDTRIANTLLRRIKSLKTRKANIEADYAKRLNNLDSRIQRIDDLSQKDYTQVAEIEKAINRIDKIFEMDKSTLDEEFDAKKAEYANKNVFIGREAKKLYDELTNLKKGTRASKQLGYLLDLGYDRNSLKSALAHIDMSPAKLVNVNSDVMISNEDQWA